MPTDDKLYPPEVPYLRLEDGDRPRAASQGVDEKIIALLQGWQDGDALREALGACHAMRDALVMTISSTKEVWRIRHDIQDFVAVSWALAHVCQQHTDRIIEAEPEAAVPDDETCELLGHPLVGTTCRCGENHL